MNVILNIDILLASFSSNIRALILYNRSWERRE